VLPNARGVPVPGKGAGRAVDEERGQIDPLILVPRDLRHFAEPTRLVGSEEVPADFQVGRAGVAA